MVSVLSVVWNAPVRFSMMPMNEKGTYLAQNWPAFDRAFARVCVPRCVWFDLILHRLVQRFHGYFSGGRRAAEDVGDVVQRSPYFYLVTNKDMAGMSVFDQTRPAEQDEMRVSGQAGVTSCRMRKSWRDTASR